MILKDYVEVLNKMVKDYGDCEVYTARDEEGNGYEQVYYYPSIWQVSETKDSLESDDLYYWEADSGKKNIVVLN